jgi:hypothetical protein
VSVKAKQAINCSCLELKMVFFLLGVLVYFLLLLNHSIEGGCAYRGKGTMASPCRLLFKMQSYIPRRIHSIASESYQTSKHR